MRRIGAVFAVVGQFVIVVVAPRLASVRNDEAHLKMTSMIAVALIAFGAMIIVCAITVPWLLLMLIMAGIPEAFLFLV